MIPACLLAALLAVASPVARSAQVDAEAETAAAAQAAEHEVAEENPNPLAVDPDLAIFTALVFLVLLAILGKFAWGPIIEALDRREKAVAEQVASAKAARDDAQRLVAEHQARLAGAADEVRQMLDQARKEAELQKQQMVAEAQEAASAEKQRALGEIEAAKNSALHELAQHSVDSAIGLAGKIVRRQLRPDDHAELIHEALQEFPNQN
jgi:F-type H+-transporting ATPase subunit b